MLLVRYSEKCSMKVASKKERDAEGSVWKCSTYESRELGALCRSYELSGESGVLGGSKLKLTRPATSA
jgi:hypothetical protein